MAILGTNQLQPVEWEGEAYCSSWLSANNPQLMSADLIGEKNQVILEFSFYLDNHT